MRFSIAGAAGSSRYALLAGVAAAAMSVPGVALAQDDEVSTEEEAEDFGNVIVVTATKREQTLQEAPVAVSVTTAEAIEQAQIRDAADLATLVPSLRVATLQASGNTSFNIRGFGNGTNNIGIEPAVAVFVDGVYRSRSLSQVSDLPDVQRVEVLRGPQSTLFGKNASAGVISLVTKEPSFDFGGVVEASYGNFDAKVLKGVVTGPVSDTVALSFAAGVNKRDGWIDDVGYDGKANERDRWFVRGQALYDNGDDFKARLIADYDKINEICCSVQPVLYDNPLILALGAQLTNTDPFDDVTATNFPSTNKIENYGVSGQLDYEMGALSLTSITSWRGAGNVTGQDSDFSTVDLLGRNDGDIQIRTFTQELRLASDFDGPINFLVGGYYFDESIDYLNDLTFGSDFRTYVDLATSGGVALVEQAVLGLPANTFFQEGVGVFDDFKLQNDAYSIFGTLDFEPVDGLTITVGANYTKDKKRGTSNTVSTDAFSALDLVAIGGGVIASQATATTVGNILMLGRPATAAEVQAFAGSQPAAFAQVQAGALAFANLNAGLTPAEAAADSDPNTVGNPLLPLRPLQFAPPFLNFPNAVEDGRTSDKDLAYTIRASYEVTPEVNVYVSYATGFKASSFNLTRDSRPLASDLPALASAGLITPNLATGTRFAPPEESKVIELGVKTNFGRAGFNLTVFDQTIKDFQSAIFTGTGFALSSAGQQSTFGIEFDGFVDVTDGLRLNLAMTYLDPKYDDFPGSPLGDLSGVRPAGISEFSGAFGAQYEHEFDSGNRIIARADYSYDSETPVLDGLPAFIQRDGLGNVVSYQPAIDLAEQFTRQVDEVNASLTYAMENGLELTVWGRNLLNDRYFLSQFDVPIQTGNVAIYPSQPRTYGVAARFRF